MVPMTGRRKPLADRVFDEIFGDIISGDLVVGSALPPERVLTEKFGVNRQVVREAIIRLAQLGLVTQQHGNGNLVADWKASGSFDLLALLAARSAKGFHDHDALVARSLLESQQALGIQASRLCAKRTTPELVEAFNVVATRMMLSDDPLERYRLNLKFWGKVIEGSENLAFRFGFNSLKRSMLTVGVLMAHYSTSVPGDPAGFQRLAEALATGDPDVAQTAAEDLLRIVPTELAVASGVFDEPAGDPAGSIDATPVPHQIQTIPAAGNRHSPAV